jgi:type I restriction enzyme S subunit
MDQKTFLENFDVIADAHAGIQQLRKVIFDLAVEGRLISLNNDVNESNFAKAAQLKKIKDVVKTFNGNSTSAAEKARLGKNKKGIPYIATKDIEYGFQPVDYSNGLYVEVNDSRYKIAPKGSVLICLEGGSAGKKMALLDHDVAFGNKLFANVCTNELNPKFLLITFLSTKFQSQFKAGMSGIIGGISKARFSDIEISVPTIERQEETVAKVEELMALCDELEAEREKQLALRYASRDSAIDAISTATTPEELSTAWSRISNNWETITNSPESIERLRQLIISFAVKGILTLRSEIADSEHVEPIESSTKLDESKLWISSSALADVPRGWLRTPMGTLGKWGSGGTPTSTRKEYYTNGTIPWAVIGDLNEGVLLVTEKSITDKALARSSTTMIPKGSVLIAMYGASIGKTAITAIECTSNQAIAHCSPGPHILGEYLLLLAKSLKFELIDSGQGAAQPNISQTVIKHLLVDIPPIRIQREIVGKVDELMAFCKEIEVNLNLRTEIQSSFAHASSQLLTV